MLNRHRTSIIEIFFTESRISLRARTHIFSIKLPHNTVPVGLDSKNLLKSLRIFEL